MTDDLGRGHLYDDIISVPNLLSAWREFVAGKRGKNDVQQFQLNLMDNILGLHAELRDGSYSHGPYEAFKISDPKPRDIHKASVRDRLLHHAVYRALYPVLDRQWIHDSYSCRTGKGVHKALDRYTQFARRVTKNHTKTAWVLKCDVRKFFASIDQTILLRIFAERIPDDRLQGLIGNIVDSFYSTEPGKGLPLGNLTSQVLVNLYMNEFDRYVKHELRETYYIRYADDFLLMSRDRLHLERLLQKLREFLDQRLELSLHPNKVTIQTVASGVDFLGWVHFPYHRVIRTTTKRRTLQATSENLASYLGLLSHGNAVKLRHRIASSLGYPGSGSSANA